MRARLRLVWTTLRLRRGRAVSLGFSLLEVMVAIAILGLTLTVILSAQGGLAASNKSAANMGLATTYGRCKMTELEERLLKLGYPVQDNLQTEVSCCDDLRDDSGFTCDTRIEKVVLPNPPQNSLDGGDMFSALASASASASASPGALASGGLGALASQIPGASPSNNPLGGAGLNFDGGLQNLGSNVMQQMGPGGMGAQGLLSMVMGLVYPSMKLLYEASIRRLTVTVRWHEGPNAKELGLVQYVTSPQQAGMVAGAAASASASAGAPQINGNPGGIGAPGIPGAAPGVGGMLH